MFTTITFSVSLASNLVYRFESLRDIVKDHEVTYNPSEGNGPDPRLGELVKFTKPELVYRPSEDFRNFSVTPNDVLDFLRCNRNFLIQDTKDSNFRFNENHKSAEQDESHSMAIEVSFERIVKNSDNKAKLVVFDDMKSEGWDTQIVYAIIIHE